MVAPSAPQSYLPASRASSKTGGGERNWLSLGVSSLHAFRSAEGRSAPGEAALGHANDRPATRAGWPEWIAAGVTSGLRISVSRRKEHASSRNGVEARSRETGAGRKTEKAASISLARKSPKLAGPSARAISRENIQRRAAPAEASACAISCASRISTHRGPAEICQLATALRSSMSSPMFSMMM